MHAACLRRRPAAPSATRVQICAFKNDWIYIINRGLPLLSLPSSPPVSARCAAAVCLLQADGVTTEELEKSPRAPPLRGI